MLLPRTVAVALLVGSCLTAGILGTYLALRRPAQSGSLDQPPGLSGAAEDHAGAPPSGNAAGAGAETAAESATDGSGVGGTGETEAGQAEAGGPPNAGGPGSQGTGRPYVLLPPRQPSTPAGSGMPTWGPLIPGGASAGQPGSAAAGASGVAGVAPGPARELEVVELPVGTALTVAFTAPVSSAQAKVEDKVTAETVSDVRIGDRMVLPAGSAVTGTVAQVVPGGRLKQRAVVAVLFDTVVSKAGGRSSLRTKPVIREGDSPLKQSALKVGVGAVGGAIAGMLLGGSKGAVTGGATGAAAGAASTVSGPPLPATIAAGTRCSLVLEAPMEVKVEKRH